MEWDINARYDRSFSNLFDAENLLEGKASLSFPKPVSDYTYKVAVEKQPGDPEPDSVEVESLRRPFMAFASVVNYERNPTMQQAYGDGWIGNSFNSDSAFSNRRLELFRLGIEWRGKRKKTNYGGLEGHRVRLTGFRSRQFRMIYPDQAMVLQQAPDGAFLEFVGAEIDVRFRLGKWSFENTMTTQTPAVSGDQALFDYYRTNQPNFHNRLKLFWEGHDIKIARAVRGGIEYHYFSNFNVPLFDAPSQMFYPQTNIQQAGYHRLDAFFCGSDQEGADLFPGLQYPGRGGDKRLLYDAFLSDVGPDLYVRC